MMVFVVDSSTSMVVDTSICIYLAMLFEAGSSDAWCVLANMVVATSAVGRRSTPSKSIFFRPILPMCTEVLKFQRDALGLASSGD